MSFSGDAKVARDPTAPLPARVRAWKRCLFRYAPYGYAQTVRHLRDRFGPAADPDTPIGHVRAECPRPAEDPMAAVLSALAALERSREIWLRDVAAFAANRRQGKARGSRRATPDELARVIDRRWPGGFAAGGPADGSPGDRPVSPGFLAAYGLAAWVPAPVGHRRRVRQLPTPPGLFDGWGAALGWGCAALVVAVCLVATFVGPPPPWSLACLGIAWLTGLGVVGSRLMVRTRRWRRETADYRSTVIAAAQQAEVRCAAQRMSIMGVRQATGADRGAITRSLSASWGSATIVVGGRARDASTLAALILRTDGEPTSATASGDGSRSPAIPGGLLTYEITDAGLEIVTLDAAPQHAGTGTRLLQAAAIIAAGRGIDRIWLVTTNDNLDALRFYQRRGFRIAAVNRGAVDAARRIKREIPKAGAYGIDLHDELVLEWRQGAP